MSLTFCNRRAIKLRTQKPTVERSCAKKSEKERIYSARESRSRYKERKKYVLRIKQTVLLTESPMNLDK
jgi:hypothetical protein